MHFFLVFELLVVCFLLLFDHPLNLFVVDFLVAKFASSNLFDFDILSS